MLNFGASKPRVKGGPRPRPPPPLDPHLRHLWKITLPQTSFSGGNNILLLLKILNRRSSPIVCVLLRWPPKVPQITSFRTTPNNIHVLFRVQQLHCARKWEKYACKYNVCVLVCVEMSMSSLHLWKCTTLPLMIIRQINIPAYLRLMTGWWVPVSTILMVAGQTDNGSLSHTMGTVTVT